MGADHLLALYPVGVVEQCSLLDIGPTAEGEIIQPEQDGLLQAGAWLKQSGRCVFDTVGSFYSFLPSLLLMFCTYKQFWFQTPQDIPSPTASAPMPMRFLTTPTTFCIVTFATPSNSTVAINKRLPILEGDEVIYLAPTANGNDARSGKASLPWMMDAETGQTIIDVSAVQSEIEEGEFAWAFEVRYA